MRKYLRFLRPEFMFTPQIFITVLAWSSLLHFAEVRSNPSTHIPQRLFAEVVATAATFLTIWLLSKPLLRGLAADQLWQRMIPITVFATAIRGAVFNGLLIYFDYPSRAGLFLRVTASVYSILFGVLASTIALGVLRTHAQTRARLVAEQRRLQDVQQRITEQLHELDDELANSIKQDLHQAVDRLTQTPPAELLPLLRATIDDVVRPLSHYLQSKAKNWSPPAAEVVEPKVQWGDVLRQGLRSERFMPVRNTAVLVFAGMPVMAQSSNFLQFVSAVSFVFVFGTAVFSIAKRASLAFGRRSSDLRKAFGFVIALACSGALTAWALTPFGIPRDLITAFVLLAALFTPLGGILISVAITSEQQLAMVDEQLEEATQRLAWETARSRAFYRQRHRTLTHALHGQVQAAFAAAYLRLSPLISDEAHLAKALPPIAEQLHRTIEAVSTAPEAVDDCASVASKVAANWIGVAEVRFTISPACDRALDADALARTVVVDLIPELSFNAVKHGAASAIEISLALASEQLIELTVRNNGEAPTNGQPGLGTSLLEECTVAWERSKDQTGNGTVVRALIPTAVTAPAL